MERVMFLWSVQEQKNIYLSNFYSRNGGGKEEIIMRTNKIGNKNWRKNNNFNFPIAVLSVV